MLTLDILDTHLNMSIKSFKISPSSVKVLYELFRLLKFQVFFCIHL